MAISSISLHITHTLTVSIEHTKEILDGRRDAFAWVFGTNIKEKASNKVTIEDIELGILHQLLHYFYTGQVTAAKMGAIGADLCIAAKKYQIMKLKTKCENYFLRHMFPHNCVVFVLHLSGLKNPTELTVKAVKFFHRIIRRTYLKKQQTIFSHNFFKHVRLVFS